MPFTGCTRTLHLGGFQHQALVPHYGLLVSNADCSRPYLPLVCQCQEPKQHASSYVTCWSSTHKHTVVQDTTVQRRSHLQHVADHRPTAARKRAAACLLQARFRLLLRPVPCWTLT
jgi:hypothetical protein